MRIVLLTNDNFFSYTVLEDFLKQRKDDIKLIVFSSALVGKKSLFASVAWLLRETGFRHTAFKLLVYGVFKLMRVACNLLPFFPNHYSTFIWAKRQKMPFVISPLLNSEDVVERIRKLEPDLIVSVSMNQIAKKEILEMPTHRCINVHCAPLPRYGGMSPYVWALANNESHSAATIHYMDEGLDSGDIIVQEGVKVMKNESAFSLFYRCCLQAAELLQRVVRDIEANRATSYAQDMDNKSYFSWPTKDCITNLRLNGYSLARSSDFLFALFKRKPRINCTLSSYRGE
ncbi:MAG: hypothetical protein CMI31_15085 [Opitutae bacterium]|nr:hypothetical protein [Opitutae bacterium]